MAGKLAFLHALSPLHCGTGQGVGSIDLPIARERATNLPLVPGSTIKGCVRDALRPPRLSNEQWVEIFGPKRGEGSADSAGALRVSDAHLLLLPVRCLAGTFVWVTCPFILHRLRRDALAAGVRNLPAVPSIEEGSAMLGSADPLITLGGKKKLVLEELDFSAEAKTGAVEWVEWIANHLYTGVLEPWRVEMKNRFAIVDDKNFTYLAEFSTEVNAHIAINADTGTVASGALWYQESLPAETVCYFLLQAAVLSKKTMDAEQVLSAIGETSDIQFGGKATTGLGIARMVPVGGGK